MRELTLLSDPFFRLLGNLSLRIFYLNKCVLKYVLQVIFTLKNLSPLGVVGDSNYFIWI